MSSFTFFSFFSFLMGSHLETLLFTIKSITTSSEFLFSCNNEFNSSDSQSGNISVKLVSSGEALLLVLFVLPLVSLLNLFSWFLKLFRCVVDMIVLCYIVKIIVVVVVVVVVVVAWVLVTVILLMFSCPINRINLVSQNFRLTPFSYE